MNKKSLLAISMAAVTMLSATMPAFAADQIFTEDGTANVPVTCEIESSYKVSLPATIALAKNEVADEGAKSNYAAGFKIGVTGNIDSDKFVNVLPDTTDFVMKDTSGKRSTTPAVYANKVSWSAADLDAVDDDVYVETGTMVEATIPKAGKYNGKIAYTFQLSETAAENEHQNASATHTGVTDEGKLVNTTAPAADPVEP